MNHSKKLALLLCLSLAGCAASKKKPEPVPAAPKAEVRPEKSATPRMSSLKKDIVGLAKREWDFFGRQTVVLDGEEESIPHVGKWEDDEEVYVFRVNWYWRAVGKPGLTGKHCREPWSAAFISWIMKEVGVPEYQFAREEAHWAYLSRIVADSGDPYAAFVPREVSEYSPQPGDLVCATRGHGSADALTGLGFRSVLMEHTQLHCDIVVERGADTLGVIGGNVRNSVSKTLLRLDQSGRVQPTRRRPWFLVLENRL